MAKYFSYFPKTVYNLGDPKALDTITNLTTTFSLDESTLNNTILYYEYTVPEGETPEIIAHKFYGDVEQHWLIMKMNNIVDPKADWPMDSRTFASYIEEKYANNGISQSTTGYQWAKSNNHSYYKIETRTLTLTGQKTVDKIQIDANTYTNVQTSTSTYTLADGYQLRVDVDKTVLSYYDYELELNDDRRNIKIMKPEYVSTIQDEFVRVMSNG
jgi:hypothetical protein